MGVGTGVREGLANSVAEGLGVWLGEGSAGAGEAEGVWVGLEVGRIVPGRNQSFEVLSDLKKFISRLATFLQPCVEGCVPSEPKSVGGRVSPSVRGTLPFAHMYGPQAIHGAVTEPFSGS